MNKLPPFQGRPSSLGSPSRAGMRSKNPYNDAMTPTEFRKMYGRDPIQKSPDVPQFTSDLYKNMWQRFLFESNNDIYAAAQKMEQRFKENYENWQAASKMAAENPAYRDRNSVAINQNLNNILNNQAAFGSWLDKWISQQQANQSKTNMPPAWN